jgi:hypothetical protein
MTTIRLLPLTALLTVGTLFGGATSALAEISVGEVLDAIREEHCISEYWVPRPLRPSEVWPVTVRIDGDVAYAWVERLETPRTRWTTFYAMAFKGGKTIITSRMGYNTEIMQDNFGYRESKTKVFGDDWSKHQFGVDVRAAGLERPFKCTRVFEPDSPTKLAMIDSIQKSVAVMLPFGRDADRLPERVRIAIGNFNVDDGHTYVVLRETNEVLGVLLDSGSAEGPIDRKYIVWEPSHPSEVPKIRSKVLATGIEREIRLDRK